MSPKKRSLLKICDLRLQAHIGCLPSEREQPQEISISLDIAFNSPPLGETSDKLEETLCYAEISKLIEDVVYSKHHALIEHLAARIHASVADYIDDRALFNVSINKLKPPVNNLKGGVHYTCGDWIR